MSKSKVIVLSRVIKQTVVFCEDDFETTGEWVEFKQSLMDDNDALEETFIENLDYDNFDVMEDIKLTKEDYDDHFSI